MLQVSQLSKAPKSTTCNMKKLRVLTPQNRKQHELISKVIPAEEYEIARAKKLKSLPISPHLTIYKFPFPAFSSITHRITGVALTGIFGTLGVVALKTSPHELPLMIDAWKAAHPNMVPLAKAAIAFPISYHTLFGIRHLIWDTTAKGVNLPSAYSTGYALVAATAVATVAATLV